MVAAVEPTLVPQRANVLTAAPAFTQIPRLQSALLVVLALILLTSAQLRVLIATLEHSRRWDQAHVLIVTQAPTQLPPRATAKDVMLELLLEKPQASARIVSQALIQSRAVPAPVLTAPRAAILPMVGFCANFAFLANIQRQQRLSAHLAMQELSLLKGQHPAQIVILVNTQARARPHALTVLRERIRLRLQVPVWIAMPALSLPRLVYPPAQPVMRASSPVQRASPHAKPALRANIL